ncbi:MAG TPA: peptidoglycan-binding domain-containing protein, partial [Clostridia bacterium]|nr:peptidoglycan-binding domain-containing protein [Clostridia bacterium]
ATVAAAALQSCSLSYTGMTMDTLRERALSYALQYGLAEPTPAPSEDSPTPTPEPTPEETPEPAPTETPAATATPTPAPVALTPEDARARAVSVVRLSFEAAKEAQHFAMPETVESYLIAHTRTVESEGRYVCAVTLPNLAKWTLPDASKYKGENPSTYLAAFAEALRASFEALKPETDMLGGALLGAAVEADPKLTAAFAALGQSMEAWLAEALAVRNAYPALTRLALDQDGGAALWKEADLADKASRPVFAAEEKRKTLKNGSKGSAVRAIQQALIDQGYLTGRPDGTFGRQTEL